MMRKYVILIILMAQVLVFSSCATTETAVENPATPEQAIQLLKSQNEKYVSNTTNEGDISLALREETVINGQSPYAVVLTCSDSRVVPEHIFMEGINRIFTVRNAGNIVSENALGSVEYGVAHLDAKVVLVLGHTECGAVNATINNMGHDNILFITDEISHAIQQETDPTKAEIMNVQNSISKLMESEIIADMLENEEIEIIGGIYNTSTGVVEFLD